MLRARVQLGQAARVFSDMLRHKVDDSGTNYHRVVRRVTRALRGVSEETLFALGEEAYRNSIEKSLYQRGYHPGRGTPRRRA